MNKMFTVLMTVLLQVGTLCAQNTPVLPPYLDESKPIDERVEDALRRMTLDEKIAVIHAQSKFSAPGVKRLGFPDMWTDDGPHGVRPDVLWDEWEQAGQTNDSCVAFPALTCLAATWNPQLARLYGESLGEEALYRGKAMILGPGVNINRTPLGGRNFEYMGEDPFLAGRMVIPYVQGLQSKGVAACVKHYALNNDEEYRHQVNVVVSDRALREIYLPAFEAAVCEGEAWAIMGAYNLYKNQHNCHNDILLTQILKGEWGFDGVVVSDWGGCHNMDEAVHNGLDMEFGTWTDGLTMGATNAYDNYHLALAYKHAIQEGRYTTRELDDKVRRVLRLHFRTTMRTNRGYGFLCSESHYAAARQIAGEGIVLLKNEKVENKNRKSAVPLLPIDITRMKRILVVGENAIKMMTVGGGSSSLKVQREVLPLDGLQAALNASFDEGHLMLNYCRGYVGDTVQSYNGVTVGRSIAERRTNAELRTEAVEQAKTADMVIVFGGLNKANRQDCEGYDRQQYELPYEQNELVEALAAVNKNIVFVNISGNAVAMPWIDRVPAVVQGWFIGSEAGNALADVLTGRVNPSGKLPFTWFRSLNDIPAHALGTYPGTWRNDHQVIDEKYTDDIYVGYRWADLPAKRKAQLGASAHLSTRKGTEGESPLFPFGYGLSYTTFRIDHFTAEHDELTSADQTLSFTVNVTNTGHVAGAETVQLYVSDVKSTVARPVKELKAFQKVYVQPGETKTVRLTIDRRALSFWNDQTNSWTAEPGDFEALVGTSSGNITARQRFKLKE